MHPILEAIGRHRLLPVIVIENAAHAEPLGHALLQGGLPCAEVTFRTAAAAAAIAAMARIKGLLVGAGTVINLEQARQARDAGAQFIVSPGFNPKVVSWCLDNHLPITPGVCTPTDITLALEFGLDVLKFFPAETFGGLPTLKALSAPFPAVRFIPTGGITPLNLPAYLAFPKVLACGGSWMVPPSHLQSASFPAITELVREAVHLAQSPR